MTAASLTLLPVQFGGTLLASTGRLALALAARFMRAPLANTGIAALVAMSALAASNAMYFQPHALPAPLFGPAPVADDETGSISRSVQPVVPLPRPAGLKFSVLPAVPVAEKPTEPTAATSDGPIGNKDVFEVQRKLEDLRLFSGTIDGYYGPQTAAAIRKFQDLVGIKPTGELTQDIIGRILDAPLTLGRSDAPAATAPAITAPSVDLPAAPQAAVAAPAQTVSPQASSGQPDRPVDPQTLAMTPLPTPEPLVAASDAAPRQQAASTQPTVLGRPLPTSAEGALKMAAKTAGDAIDTIISGVQTVTERKIEPAKAAYVAPPKELGPQPQVAAAATAAPNPQTAAAKPDVRVAEAAPFEAMPQSKPGETVTDPTYVAKVQRGLASLGFLHGPADGVAGEATAKAIRNFEVYFDYGVTGRITPDLLGLLVQNGASI